MTAMIAEIKKIVEEKGVATLATDYYWYCEGQKSPYEGRVPEGVTRYDKEILEEELLAELKSNGLEAKLLLGQDSFYYIR